MIALGNDACRTVSVGDAACVGVYVGDAMVFPDVPTYDETKIAVIELDENDEPTDVVTYVEGTQYVTPIENVNSTLYTLYNTDSTKRYMVRYGSNIDEDLSVSGSYIRCPNAVRIVIHKEFSAITPYYAASATNLKSVLLPETITTIGESAFDSCNALEEINFPDSITSIGKNAFAFTSGLSEISIPNSLETLGDGAFYQCGAQSDIIFPTTTRSIGNQAFYQSEITSIEFNQNLQTLGTECCENCANLVSAVLPPLVMIPQDTLSGCTALASVVMPDGVEQFHYNTFYNCTSITAIELPSTITSIVPIAFSSCTSLATIAINKPENSISGAPWGATNATVVWTG